MFEWLLKGHWGYCSALYMGVLQRWISRTRIVDFHETLNLTCCRLELRNLAVSTPFLELIGFRSHLFSRSFSPFVEVSLHCSLPQCINTTHSVRAPGELFIISRTRQAYPVIPYTVLPSLSCVRD